MDSVLFACQALLLLGHPRVSLQNEAWLRCQVHQQIAGGLQQCSRTHCSTTAIWDENQMLTSQMLYAGGPPRPGMPPPQFAQRPPGQGAPQFMPPAGFRPGMPPQRPGMPPPGMPPPGVSKDVHFQLRLPVNVRTIEVPIVCRILVCRACTSKCGQCPVTARGQVVS